MILSFLVLFLIIGSSGVVSSSVSSEEEKMERKSDFADETSARNYVWEVSPPESKEECRSRVRVGIRKSFWNLSAMLIEYCRDHNMDVSSVVYKEASDVNAKLKDLKSRLRKKNKVSISPAFQWAQTKHRIYLSVKLAHKMDTPATLGCVVTKSSFDPSGVKFRADCEKQRKSFFLTVETFKALNPENCTWDYNSVGRVTFTLFKNETQYWPRLLKAKSKPGNMHVWWDMKQRLEKEEKEETKRLEEEKKRLKKQEEEAEKKRNEKNNSSRSSSEANSTSTTTNSSTKEDL